MADFSVDTGALQDQGINYKKAITLASAERSRADAHMKNVLDALTNMNKSHVKTINDLHLLVQEAEATIERLEAMIAKNALLLSGAISKAQAAAAAGDIAGTADASSQANMYSEWINTENSQRDIAVSVLARAKTELAKSQEQLGQQMIASMQIANFNETAAMHTSAIFRGGILAEKIYAFAVAVDGKDSAAAAVLEGELLANMPNKDYWTTEEGKKFQEFFNNPATASMRAEGAAAQLAKESRAWNAAHPGASDILSASATGASAKLQGQVSDVYDRKPTNADPWDKTLTDFQDTSDKARANSEWWNHYGPWIQGAAMTPAIATAVIGGGILIVGGAGAGAAAAGTSAAALPSGAIPVGAGAAPIALPATAGAGTAAAGAGTAGTAAAGAGTAGTAAAGATTAARVVAARNALAQAASKLDAAQTAYKAAKGTSGLPAAREALKRAFEEHNSLQEALRLLIGSP